MTDAVDLMQLSVHVSQALIGEMIKTGWENSRTFLARVFKRGGQEAQNRHLDMLDRDRASLTQASADRRDELENDLRQRWTIQLAAFLQQYPEAADDLRELLAALSPMPDTTKTQATLTAMNNINSQILQAGGDIRTGGGNINYQRPGQDQK